MQQGRPGQITDIFQLTNSCSVYRLGGRAGVYSKLRINIPLFSVSGAHHDEIDSLTATKGVFFSEGKINTGYVRSTVSGWFPPNCLVVPSLESCWIVSSGVLS
jgi:hypothetical protein